MNSTDFWTPRTAIVTGGGGFVGSHVIEALRARGATRILTARSRQYDLRDITAVRRLIDDGIALAGGDASSVVVLHLAGVVGGIAANQKRPADFFYENLMMGVQLIHESYRRRVGKFVGLGTICAYPKLTPVPFSEDDLWNGYPEETNAPYGLAKKMMLVQSEAYRRQYDFNSIILFPVNLYGPRDNFDPELSHVIPALIKKCCDAVDTGRNEIVVWGDGSATREFLYVGDAAEGIVLAAERYDGSDPVNLGSSFEISVRDLVGVIAEATGFHGRMVWDTTRPNGQPRRKLDITRAAERFGFHAHTNFGTGLRRTVAWYREHVRSVAAP